jgi:hypothetical protein
MLLVFISFMPLAHPDVSKRLRVAIERPPKTGFTFPSAGSIADLSSKKPKEDAHDQDRHNDVDLCRFPCSRILAPIDAVIHPELLITGHPPVA